MADYRNLPVGTRVYYLGQLPGKIVSKDSRGIFVIFDVLPGNKVLYLPDGSWATGFPPVIFLRPYDLEVTDAVYELPVPPDPPIDTIAWGRNSKSDPWRIGYFKGRDDKGQVIFNLSPNIECGYTYREMTTENPYAT